MVETGHGALKILLQRGLGTVIFIHIAINIKGCICVPDFAPDLASLKSGKAAGVLLRQKRVHRWLANVSFTGSIAMLK